MGHSSDDCILVRSKKSLHGLLQNVAPSEPSLAYGSIHTHTPSHAALVRAYSESVGDAVDHGHVEAEAFLGRSHGNLDFLHGNAVWDGEHWRLILTLGRGRSGDRGTPNINSCLKL